MEWIRLTHSYVLAEFVALAETRDLPPERALQFVAAVMDNPEIEVAWVTEDRHRAAMRLLQERLDNLFTLRCDQLSAYARAWNHGSAHD